MECTMTLNTRFGGGGSNPSWSDLQGALKEVFVEENPHCSEAEYREHPNAWLDYGFQNGDKWTVYTLDVYRTGEVRFTKWDDQDDDAPEFEMKMEAVGLEQASALWRLMADGKLDSLLEENWRP